MRAFVDQINGGMVKLLIGDDSPVVLEIPMEWIDCPIREGDVLRLSFVQDEDGTQRAKSQVSQLLNELGDNP